MGAKYVLKQASDGQFMFNLAAGNGEIILTSERYPAKAGAEGGIAAVRVNSPIDERYERKKSTISGSPYFVLKAANGETIGVSENYSSTIAMEAGIRSVKTNGPTATVEDTTTRFARL